MEFESTRNSKLSVSFSKAITDGISSDGGLYVPKEFPSVSADELNALCDMEYPEIAATIIGKYATDFTHEELSECAKGAYERFDGEAAPVVKIDEGLFLLELFHGPTLAFKDIALTLLPRLLPLAAKKCGVDKEYLILVATSGDTGKAALEGFSGVSGTNIIVFYPSEGVSMVQKLQMTTQEGDNVYVAAVRGNFDNCQTAVKKLFCDKTVIDELNEKNIVFSSANSINFGRLLPQIVYYFSSYAALLQSGEIEAGEEINFAVPTGNFGDILAGYYAKRMGLPVGRFICASNSNNVLTDFFESGKYDANRHFYKTISPSMDILVSSNLERLVYEISGRDDELTKERMDGLKSTGIYEISKKELAELQELFSAEYASENDTKATINGFYDEFGYALDPHTAVGVYAADVYQANSGDYAKTVVVATASPYKFCEDVLSAIGVKRGEDVFRSAKKLYGACGVPVPTQMSDLEYKEIRFAKEYDSDKLYDAIEDYLGSRQNG